jgi:hypothetical protein
MADWVPSWWIESGDWADDKPSTVGSRHEAAKRHRERMYMDIQDRQARPPTAPDEPERYSPEYELLHASEEFGLGQRQRDERDRQLAALRRATAERVRRFRSEGPGQPDRPFGRALLGFLGRR